MILKDSYEEPVETSENILAPNLKYSAEKSSGYIDSFYEISPFSSGKYVGINSIFLPTPMAWQWCMEQFVCVCVYVGVSVGGEGI